MSSVESVRVASGPRAGFWQRLVAAAVDWAPSALILVALIAALKGFGLVLWFIAAVSYYTYFEGSVRGQTLGKRALGVRVVDVETKEPIGYGRAFVRYVGRFVSAIAVGLGYLWMLWDDEKQTWHDKFSTAVVVPESSYPLDTSEE